MGTSRRSLAGPGPRAPRTLAGLIALAISLAMLGCTTQLTPPGMLVSSQAQLWGIAPFANESGTSAVDTARIADAFMIETQQVSGLNAIPVNRVIGAMRELGLDSIESHGDALALMNVLELDGLIVGTVTAYDPYRPMTLGLAVQLFSRSAGDQWNGLDTRKLTSSPGETASPGEVGPPHPVAQAAYVFDAESHLTVTWLEEYAKGRNEPDSAYGPDVYLVSMDLYARFACHRLLSELLSQEQQRLTPPVAKTTS